VLKFSPDLPNHSLDASPVKHGKDVTQLNTKASDMNRNFIKPLTLAVFAVTLLLASAAPPFGWSARAQQTSDVRKVKTKVVPEYPDLARKLKIKGIARVQLTITAQGAVSEVKELGGNPVLLQSLVQAVKQWKYEPAKSESVVEVKYEFI